MNSEEYSEIIDKFRIREVMARYVQGVDRRDANLLKSCYHADAYEVHHVFNGNAHEFADWRARQTFRTHHLLSASAIEVDGARAHAETPYSAVVHVDLNEQGMSGVIETQTNGWYLDLFAKRNGIWKIMHQRVVVFDQNARFVPDTAARGIGEQTIDDPFLLGFDLANDPPPPQHVNDAAAVIREHFLANTRPPENATSA